MTPTFVLDAFGKRQFNNADYVGPYLYRPPLPPNPSLSDNLLPGTQVVYDEEEFERRVNEAHAKGAPLKVPPFRRERNRA